MEDLKIDMLDINNTGNCFSHVCDLFDLDNIIDKLTCLKTPTGALLDVILTPNTKSICAQDAIEIN